MLAAIVLSLVFTLTGATPFLKHSVDPRHPAKTPEIERRQSSPFTAVTGITTFGAQPRLEIRELQKNTDQWNLYLLGLARFYAINQTEKLSYYQIAGIHGRPYAPWDNVQAPLEGGTPGYCAHVSNIFLPWHRPYLALFEQVLYQHIVAVVNEFPAGPQRQRYAAAAISWRSPYWDWAMEPPVGQSVWPDFMSNPTITVTMPNGTADIANPLFSYKFHPVSVSDFYYNPFATWNETKRYPTSWDLDATSQNNLLGPMLDNNRMSVSDRLYNLFTYYNNFTQFGTEAWMSQAVSNADSLESLHDVIHSLTGMSGMMTYLDYSAFDPVFWLHHAMIDRCFALWQALHNDSYVEPLDAKEGTFAFGIGTPLNANSSLFPFHRDAAGTFWTAASARSVRTFGYTYKDLGNGTPAEVGANVRRLYGNSAGAGGRTFNRLGGTASKTLSSETVTEYLVHIVSEKFALQGSYAIYAFMGAFDDDPKSWAVAANLTGIHAVFAALNRGSPEGYIQAKKVRDVQVSGSIPLTSKIVEKYEQGEISDMQPSTIEKYLANNLQWRIGLLDGTEVAARDMSNLEVTVIRVDVSPVDKEGSTTGKSAGRRLFSVGR